MVKSGSGTCEVAFVEATESLRCLLTELNCVQTMGPIAQEWFLLSNFKYFNKQTIRFEFIHVGVWIRHTQPHAFGS